jgi:hypothetical protein
VKKNPPTRKLREHPDLDQLKRQAKELLEAYGAGDADAVAEVNAHYRSADPEKFALHDAQLVLARSYGFDSWPKLKAYVDGVSVRRLADSARAGDLAQVRALLKVRPELAHMGIDDHGVLHFAVLFRLVLERCDANIPGRPQDRGQFGLTILHSVAGSRAHVTPEERVAFATMLLDAGARLDVRDNLLKSTPLGWACRWGRIELVKLLLQRGADPVEPDAEPWATPRAWAQKMRHDAVLALLREYGR